MIFKKLKDTCKRGFTLVELMIVITIIGILFAIVAPKVIRHFGGGQVVIDVQPTVSDVIR